MKKMIVSSLVLTTLIQSSAFARDKDLDVLFGVAGGVAGAVIGNQFGNRDTRVATTIIGAVAGTLIGHELGRALEENDRRAYVEAHRHALDGRVNEHYRWDGSSRGSRSGARGDIVILREGRKRRGTEVCREYESVINVGRKQEVTRGIACRRGDGSWYEVKEQEVSFDGVVVQSQRTESRSEGMSERNIERRNERRERSRAIVMRPRLEYKCISRDNDGQRPYVLAIRDTATYQMTKISNLVFTSTQDCENTLNEAMLIDDDVYVCASRDRDGQRPYSLYTLNRGQADRINLSFPSISGCKDSLLKSRITSEVVALCSSRDNDGQRPYNIFTINRRSGNLNSVPESYNSIEQCYNNL